MNPEISIIVPIYKVEPYIRKCVDSILAQTFTDFELILVDDGSPDSCGEICDNYAKADPRITVIHKENGGLSSARNAGIKIAKGKYIGFVDSDDYINEKMYEVLYNNAVLHSSDLVVCDFLKVNVTHGTKQYGDMEPELQHFTNIQALNQLYQSNDGALDPMGRDCEKWILTWNKLYKRCLFEDLKFKEDRIYEDEFIAHRILYKSSKIISVSGELYYYVQRPNSIVNSPFTTKKFDKVYARKERADFFREIKQYELHDKAMKSYMEVFFWNYLVAKSGLTDVKKELKDLKKTLNKSILFMMKNPHISSKQKIAIAIFIVNPFIYEVYKKQRMIRQKQK